MGDYVKRFLLAILFTTIICILILVGKEGVAKANELEDLQWIWPTDGIITDTFGTRKGQHKGIDIASMEGTPILAVDSGVVTRSYLSPSYGHVIFIKHESGYETVYAHLKNRKYRVGEFVQKGTTIGLMGSTGRSTGPHLHFEVHKEEWTVGKEQAINPFEIFGVGEVGQAVVAGKKKIDPIYEVAKMEVVPFTYIVQKGDTVWSIAKKYGIQVNQIYEYNQLQKATIYPGQKIKLWKYE